MTTAYDSRSEILSKVPAVTLGFWIIKILATTLGETGGDSVTMSWLAKLPTIHALRLPDRHGDFRRFLVGVVYRADPRAEIQSRGFTGRRSLPRPLAARHSLISPTGRLVLVTRRFAAPACLCFSSLFAW